VMWFTGQWHGIYNTAVMEIMNWPSIGPQVKSFSMTKVFW